MFQNVRNILSRRFTEREAYEHASTTYTKLLAKLEKREGAWTTDSRGQQPEKSVADDRALREAVSNAATDLAEFRKHYQNVINVTVRRFHAMHFLALSIAKSVFLRHKIEYAYSSQSYKGTGSRSRQSWSLRSGTSHMSESDTTRRSCKSGRLSLPNVRRETIISTNHPQALRDEVQPAIRDEIWNAHGIPEVHEVERA
mmetsp:Transcript_30297/g.116190  ORF Transcript_30297/g.116190 Transcript_30297/m.116190 type:complete len:199 (+) Transcript_30297:1526-2122(+)